MRTIIKNPFLEFNMILFPIWVGFSYLIFKSFFVNEKLAFLIAMLIFGETHFASTYLFYFKKENFNYLKENINKLVYIPIILLSVYFFIGLKNIDAAILIAAVGSGIHVTRQSIGIQRLYQEVRNIKYEMLTYFASGLFLFIGFFRFYLDYTEKSLGTNLYLDQVFLFSQNLNFFYLFVFLLLSLGLISILEKTNYKKKLANLTGVALYSPYMFVDQVFDAAVIGVGAHWCQYLAINYKVYFYKEVMKPTKLIIILSFIFIYSLFMTYYGYTYLFDDSVINFLILLPLTAHMFHFYTDAFIWKFSDEHIRNTVGKKLFS